MKIFWTILAVLILSEALWTLFAANRFRRFFLRRSSMPLPGILHWPRAVVLAPCKGRETGLRENIDSWLSQDYPDYQVVFIVESENDPVLTELKEFPEARIQIAGISTDCGQKVHNLRHAILQLPDDVEVIAFVDSDAWLRPDWLKSLVARLLESPGDAATGYRWFSCHRMGMMEILRSAWNSSVLTLFGETGHRNFAWGGSMAILRKTFAEADILRFWEGSLSDDYALTNALRAAGRAVHFVPRAMAVTSGRTGIREFFSWAGRQLLITRLYFPHLWVQAFVFHILWFAWIAVGILLFPAAFLVTFLLVQTLQGIKAEIRLQCVRSVIPGSAPSSVPFWIAGPVVGFSNFLMLLGNLFQRKIRWRGIEYEVQTRNRLRRTNRDG